MTRNQTCSQVCSKRTPINLGDSEADIKYLKANIFILGLGYVHSLVSGMVAE